MDCLLKCSVEASHPCDCPDLPEVCPAAVEVTDFHRQKMLVFPGVPLHSWLGTPLSPATAGDSCAQWEAGIPCSWYPWPVEVTLSQCGSHAGHAGRYGLQEWGFCLGLVLVLAKEGLATGLLPSCVNLFSAFRGLTGGMKWRFNLI